MRICIVGAGVIGSIYGQLFAENGHDVTHLVRSGGGQALRNGLLIDLLDARGSESERRLATYRPAVIESLDPERPFDLIFVSVRHHQLPELVPTLAAGAGPADIVFFSNLWTNFDPIDAHLAGRYSWGFPMAGGGYTGDRLEGALLDEVVLGEPDGMQGQRFERLHGLFTSCGLYVNAQENILDWLWVHFAVDGGLAGTALPLGGIDGLLSSLTRMVEAVGAIRDGLAVAETRGVKLATRPEAQMFFAPEYRVATSLYDLLLEDAATRRILRGRFASSDVQRVFRDLYATARALDVEVPVLSRLAPDVDGGLPLSA